MRSLAKIVGANIRRERRRQGMSQAWLAARSTVPARALSLYERGAHEPTLATLTWIAGALGVRRGMLMEGV